MSNHHLSDADLDTDTTVLDDKPAADSGRVAESTRHLTQGDLETYLEGRLSPARLQHCSAHLDSCEACRAELEDLRTFKSDLASFARPEPTRAAQQRGRRRRGLTLPQAAAIATVVVLSISAALWWKWEKPRSSKAPVAVTITRSVAPVPTASTQSLDTRLADNQPALPAVVKALVSAAIQHGKLPIPQVNTGFALLGPFGEPIADTRPEFRWQPLAGAIGYSVVIVDAGLHPVQRSPALRATSWRPRRPLRRDRTYLWQVTATLHGGSKVVASSPEALLRITALGPRKP
jgi:hypothetical protein